jgi:hypothetical protein
MHKNDPASHSGRRMPRTVGRLKLTYHLAGATEKSGFTHDVGPGGLFIRSHQVPRAGTALTLRVTLPQGESVRMTGRVRHGRRQLGVPMHMQVAGFGVQLEQAPESWFHQFI